MKLLDNNLDSTTMLTALRQSKLFDGISDAIVADCAGQFTFLRVRRRRELFRQGEACTQVYCLVRGLVHIGRVTEDGSDFTVRVVGPGDVFGDESLFRGTVRSRTATALDDCILAVCRADSMRALLTRHPALGLNLARCLQEQHDRALKRIQRISFKRARERLLAQLHELAVEWGLSKADDAHIEVTLTHAQLASLIGTSRETVSWELSELTRSGHLSRRGRKIVVGRSSLS